MKKISIASSCWNEAENILPFYERCKLELDRHSEYDYEFVISDNLSTDGTREILREIAAKDPKFKVILNANNFGHIRSPFNALLNASGDLVFYLCSDLQDPAGGTRRGVSCRNGNYGGRSTIGYASNGDD